MKKDCLWAKTALTVYRYLERVAGAVDKMIFKSALNCRDISGQNYFYNNISKISEKILNLSERKVTLINLKVLVEQVLTDVEEEDTQILIEKFFDGLKTREMTEKHGISMRTAFRKIDEAVFSFAKGLIRRGFNDNKMQDMLKNEAWILNVYQRFSNKEEDISLSNGFLAKAMAM